VVDTLFKLHFSEDGVNGVILTQGGWSLHKKDGKPEKVS